MRAKRYRVQLTGEEQEELKRRAAAYRQTHARILVLSDENQASGAMRDEEIARALKVGTANGGASAPPVRGGGLGKGLGTQGTDEPPPEETGRSGRGPSGSLGLLSTTRWACRLDAESAG